MKNALTSSAFNLSADFARQYWHAVVPNDTLLEDILKPAFWVHVAAKVKPHALIDVMTADGLLDIQLRVMRVEQGLVIVRPRLLFEDTVARQTAIAKAQEAAAVTAPTEEDRKKAPEGYKVGFNPAKKSYWVQLKATGTMLISGLPNFSAGIEYAEKHAKIANAPVGKAA